MKRFLLRCVFFLILSALALIGADCVKYYLGRIDCTKEMTLRPDTTIISIGDSHALHGLTEVHWPGLQKFSYHSLTNWQVLMRLRHILQTNETPRLKAAIFTLSTHTFYRLGYSDGQREQFTEYLPLTLPLRTDWPYTQSPIDWKLILTQPCKSFRRNDFVDTSIDTENRSLFETKPDTPFIEAALKRHYFSKTFTESSNTKGKQQYLTVYKNILTLCKKHNIRPVFITTPTHVRYRNNVPKPAIENLQLFRKILKENGALVLDYWAWPMSDNEFYDGDHLSLIGRNRFTPMLRATIESELNRPSATPVP